MSREVFEDRALSRYSELLDEFVNLAINRFNWENLPPGLNTETLELMLITNGQLMAFKSKKEGIYILPCYPSTDLNVYGIATVYNITSLNGKYTNKINIDDGVVIKNNPLATGNLSTLEIFAKRIDDIEMTQDVNLFQQCVPKIILSDETSKLTSKNLIKAISDFKFVIFGKKSLTTNITSSDVLDTSSPFLLDKLQTYKTDLSNQVLTYLGINNNNNVKKERMVTDEVNANNDFIDINIDLMFDLREKACKDINEKFGLNLKVSKREVENGEIYSNDRGTTREQSENI